jgi:hypothetical protein
MNRSFCVLFVLMFGMAGVVAPQQSPNLKSAFTKLENEFYEAIKQKNVSRLDQMLAPSMRRPASAATKIPGLCCFLLECQCYRVA